MATLVAFKIPQQSASAPWPHTVFCCRINAVISTTLWRDQYSSCGHSWQHEAFNLDRTWTVQTKSSLKAAGLPHQHEHRQAHTHTHAHLYTHTQPAALSQNPWVLKYLANNSVDCLNTCPGVLEKHLLSPHKLQTCGLDAGPVKLAESVNEADRRPQRWICALHLPKVIRQTAEVATEHWAAFSPPPPKARPPGKRNIEALQKTNQVVFCFFFVLARKLEHLKWLSSATKVCVFLCLLVCDCVHTHSVVSAWFCVRVFSE